MISNVDADVSVHIGGFVASSGDQTRSIQRCRDRHRADDHGLGVIAASTLGLFTSDDQVHTACMATSCRIRILLVVDDDTATRRASIVAGNLAGQLGGELIICRARTVRPGRAGLIESEPQAVAHELVDRIADAVAGHGVHVGERLVVSSVGQPVASILDAAHRQMVSYIVVGDSRHGRWRRRLAERSPHQLIKASPIPVITVPAEASRRPFILGRRDRPTRVEAVVR